MSAEPELNDRLASIVEFFIKLSGGFVAVYAVVEKIGKPYFEWRKERLAQEIRKVLAPELERLGQLSICNERLEVVLDRQSALFRDIDNFIVIATTNTERIDETNDLLDEVFHLDRRSDGVKRQQIDQLLKDLAERQRARKRHEDSDEHPVQKPEEQ